MGAHIDHAFKTKLGANCCCGHAVLACACLGNDALFAHTAGEDDLAQYVVDLMRACVVQLVTLEIDFCTAKLFGRAGGVIQRAWAANVMLP